MRIPRLLLEADLVAGQNLPLPPDTLHYAVTVLRLHDASPCRVFDGRGQEHHAHLRLQGRKNGYLEVGPQAADPTTPRLPLHLWQGIARGEHMDLALQKAVELGVSSITPVLLQRSRSGGGHQGLDKKWRHWMGIIQAAAAQCGRNELPRLHPVQALTPDLMQQAETTTALLADAAGRALHDLNLPLSQIHAQGITFLVGPEGGLEPEERSHLLQQGFLPLALGPRILRTETASMAGLTLFQFTYGDWHPTHAR